MKVGTSSLLNHKHNALNLTNLARICETVRDLMADGKRKEGGGGGGRCRRRRHRPSPTLPSASPDHRVVLVTSGAVGAGAARLGLTERPTDLAAKQALAAVGQVHLMRYYDDFFGALGLHCAQVLLTLDNLATRSQYLTAASTFSALFAARAIPVVNENDTVAVHKLRIGDNDTLSAQVATLVHADWLFLLTDVDALYTANPATHPAAARVKEVHDVGALEACVSTGGAVGGTAWGTGGMATKLTAARIATAAGCSTAVVHGARPDRVAAVMAGDTGAGTVFHATRTPTRGRKRWITSVPVKGTLTLDAGAAAAVRARGTSLGAAGVVGVSGEFGALDAVALADAATGAELARGLANYGAEEMAALVAAARAGSSGGGGGNSVPTLTPSDILGWPGPDEIVHRDNIALMAPRSATPTPVAFGTPPGGVEEGGDLAAAAAKPPSSPPARPPRPASADFCFPAVRPPSSSPGRARSPAFPIPQGASGGGSGGASATLPPPSSSDGPGARLAHLRERDAILAAAAAGDAFDLGTLDGALAAARAAAAAEAQAQAAGGSDAGGEDVTEEGWLPK